MPELPDVVVYVEALERHVLGRDLESIRLASPFVLRTYDPPLEESHGLRVNAVRRLGKRIVLSLAGDFHLVIHLMIAGRLRWRAPGTAPPRRNGLATFHFEHGTLLFTEASKKKRASIHLVSGPDAWTAFDRGGLEVLECDTPTFAGALRRENHTLKRTLTDPRLFSGIGNAYSDEILHRAGLSPLKWSRRLDDEEVERLHVATRDTLTEWTERLRGEVGEGFPDKVTAFRPEMAVHGRFGEPCPVCGEPVQRIVYSQNETNYCARCQTDGKVLADRALSRLLKGDWPRSLEEMEEHFDSLRRDGEAG